MKASAKIKRKLALEKNLNGYSFFDLKPEFTDSEGNFYIRGVLQK